MPYPLLLALLYLLLLLCGDLFMLNLLIYIIKYNNYIKYNYALTFLLFSSLLSELLKDILTLFIIMF